MNAFENGGKVELSAELLDLIQTSFKRIEKMDVGQSAADLQQQYAETSEDVAEMNESEIISYAIEQELIALATVVAEEFVMSGGDIKVLEAFHSYVNIFEPAGDSYSRPAPFVFRFGPVHYKKRKGRLKNLIAVKVFEYSQKVQIQPSSGELPELPLSEIELKALGILDLEAFEELRKLKQALDMAKGQQSVMTLEDLISDAVEVKLTTKAIFENIGFKPEAAAYLEEVLKGYPSYEDYENILELEYGMTS